MQLLSATAPTLAPLTFGASRATAEKAPEQQLDLFAPADEQQPPPAPTEIKHYYYSQDGLAEQMLTTQMPAEGVSAGPANDRLIVVDPNREQAAPDEEGNMLYLPNDPRFTQVQTFVAADRANDFFVKHLKRQPAWPFRREQLRIRPEEGDMLNAYYSRTDGSINFFHHENPKMGKTVYSGRSAEVVYHEMGHALLDAVRPGWISSYRDATGGIHEGFGDMLSIFVGLEDPRNLDKIIAETGGDLKQHNSVARLAEELGRSIWDERGQEQPHHDYLRNAVNGLINADPETLPWRPPNENELGREPHNYSRVISAAVYDVLASLNDQFQDQGFSVRESIEKARDVTATLAIRAFEFCPAGSLPSYGHFAAAMVQADTTDFGGRYTDTIINKMAARNIHPPAPEPPPQQPPQQPPSLDGDGPQQYLEANREVLGVPKELPLKFRSAETNERGETFVIYDYTKEIPVELEGAPVESVIVKEQGGLVLAFDKDNKLFYKNLNEITPEDEAEIRTSVRENMAEGLVNSAPLFGQPFSQNMFRSQHVPFRGYISFEDGRAVLTKSPIID